MKSYTCELKIYDLLINFFRKKSHNEIKPWVGNDELYNFFSKSSWSLVLICEWVKKKKKKNVTILVPAYFCNYPLELLKKINVKIIYYSVNESFETDLDNLNSLLHEKPDILLSVHYFGRFKNLKNEYDFCKKNNLWLIEDCTHCLFYEKVSKFSGHFKIFSPHKFFPLFSLAILVINISKDFEKSDIEFFKNNKSCIKFLDEIIYNNKIVTYNSNLRSFFWLFYKFFNFTFLKKLNYISSKKNFNNYNKFCSPKVDYISLKFFLILRINIYKINEQRKRCYLILSNFFSKFYKDKININKTNIDGVSPYFFSIKANKFKIQNFESFLKIKKIAFLKWPDLPKDKVNINNPIFSYANKIYQNNIHIHLHSFDNSTVNFLYEKKNIYINNSDNVSIIKSNFIRDDWNNFFNHTSSSNILQSWDYGEAKKKSWFVSCVERYLIYLRNDLVGVFQVIKYSFLGINLLQYLNKGPIFVDYLTDNTKNLIISKILNLLKNKFQFFFLKPNLYLNEENILIKYKNKIYYFSPVSYKSSLIDLKLDLEVILKNIDSSWRNSLNIALKNIQITYDINNEKNIKWMIYEYIQFSKNKNFVKIDKELLSYLLKKSNIIFLTAYIKERPISCVLIAKHGLSATYIAAFNNEISRKLHVNNYLLWKAIEYLKSNKFCYLDLGGINTLTTPGISMFKKKMNGCIYNLVGNLKII